MRGWLWGRLRWRMRRWLRWLNYSHIILLSYCILLTILTILFYFSLYALQLNFSSLHYSYQLSTQYVQHQLETTCINFFSQLSKCMIILRVTIYFSTDFCISYTTCVLRGKRFTKQYTLIGLYFVCTYNSISYIRLLRLSKVFTIFLFETIMLYHVLTT